GGGAGQVHHRGGYRGHGPVCGPPVQAGDEGGEGPAAEGSERHLQEKQEINAKAAGTAGGFQLVEKTLFRRIRPSVGGGARGGGSPPRVGSNALNALHGKAFSEHSEDFSAAQRRESNGIFAGCWKSPQTFSTA